MIDWLSPEARDELRRFVDERIELAFQLVRDERRWLTVKECASYLGISETAVRRRISRSRIPVRRQGRSVVVDRAALDAEIENAS